MKQRIQQIMDREGMTPGRFADSIGIQRSALSHILNGRNNPSLDVLTKVLNRFEYLSTDWLLFGNGPMFKHQLKAEIESNTDFEVSDLQMDTSVNVGLFNSIPTDPSILSASKTAVSTLPTSPVDANPVKEVVIKEVEKMRSVTRIMLFYSDNTFENFIPETPGKISKL